jgi:Kdo2-lipid IVA lauroyltransferase/acyltransferase
MELLQYKFVVIVLRALGMCAYRLPVRLCRMLGLVIGDIFRIVSPSRRRIAEENLQAAFPDAEPAWRQAVARLSYHNLGITLIELLTFPYITPNEARAALEMRGMEEVEQVLKRGTGVLLLSGHYGNWELLGFTFPLYLNTATSIIIAEQPNKIAAMYLDWYRRRTGNRTIPIQNSARTIVKRLLSGEAIALLADQAAPPEHAVFVPFFGRLAATYPAPARLALQYDIPMFAAFAERLENGQYCASIRRIPHEDLRYTPEGITELTKRHVQALEEAIRKHPELWAWQHKRWKYAPPKTSVLKSSVSDK